MALIVQKFGGSSVKDRDRIFNVARIVANTHNAGNDVVVVVSAQGATTDDLIAKAGEITHNPSAREMDMLLATGEQISISLLAMALNELGCHAISLTGWQAGFRTDRAYTKARISRLETERISSELERNRVVVVAGFQGLNKLDDITTLGRGGSDTSAVAIAAALHADRCQIYTDVEGVYTADPRKVRNTRKLEEITFDEMLELASLGAQVLNNRSVELAKKYHVNMEVVSSLKNIPGTKVKEVIKLEKTNIGGVANITWIGRNGELLAFDTGPGNAPVNDWVWKHGGQHMDYNGRLAVSGTIDGKVLASLMRHKYFAQYPPKSIDRNIFNEKLEHLEGLSLEDGAATATAFAAEAVAYSCAMYLPEMPKNMIVCGGGANNPTMVRFLRQRLPEVEIKTARDVDWNCDALEAQAFAFLAARRLYGLPSTYPSTTGAPEPIICGEIYEPRH